MSFPQSFGHKCGFKNRRKGATAVIGMNEHKKSNVQAVKCQKICKKKAQDHQS